MAARGRDTTGEGALLYRSLSALPACSLFFLFPLSSSSIEACIRGIVSARASLPFIFPAVIRSVPPASLSPLLFSFCLYPLVITTFRWYQIDQTRRALTTCRVWLCPGCSQASLHSRSTSFRVQPPPSSLASIASNYDVALYLRPTTLQFHLPERFRARIILLVYSRFANEEIIRLSNS